MGALGIDLGSVAELLGVMILIIILGGGGGMLFKWIFGKSDNKPTVINNNSKYSPAVCGEKHAIITSKNKAMCNKQTVFDGALQKLTNIQFEQGLIVKSQQKEMDKGYAMFATINTNIGKIQQDIAGLLAKAGK